MRLLIIAIACLLYGGFFQTGLVKAQGVVTLNPEKDNVLYQDIAGSLSNGSGQFLVAGKSDTGLDRRALLYFDVASSVPFGSLIDSVILRLSIKVIPVSPVNFELHRALSDWGEGASNADGNEQVGAPAFPDDATWIHCYYDTLFWAASGGDFDGAISASHTVDSLGPHTWGSTSQMVADVQGWLNNPTTNFGWGLYETTFDSLSLIRFTSREHPADPNIPELEIFYSISTDIDDNASVLPTTPRLSQNYPNPFNPNTNIWFELPERSHVSLKVYNVIGHEITTLIDENLPAGKHLTIWDGSDVNGNRVASGIYFYKIVAGDFAETKKMLLLK